MGRKGSAAACATALPLGDKKTLRGWSGRKLQAFLGRVTALECFAWTQEDLARGAGAEAWGRAASLPLRTSFFTVRIGYTSLRAVTFQSDRSPNEDLLKDAAQRLSFSFFLIKCVLLYP